MCVNCYGLLSVLALETETVMLVCWKEGKGYLSTYFEFILNPLNTNELILKMIYGFPTYMVLHQDLSIQVINKIHCTG